MWIQIHNTSSDYYLDVADEDERVVVLNLLHGGLGGERMLDDVVGVHAVAAGGGLPRVLGRPHRPEGLGSVELDTGADLLDAGPVHALHHLLHGLLGLDDGLGGGLLGLLPLGGSLLLSGNLLGDGLGALGRLGRIGLRSWLFGSHV